MSRSDDDGDGAAELQKARVAALYDRVAATYDRIGPAVFSRFGERVVEIAGIGPGARVLDVGTGRGANLFPAAERVGPMGAVVGIDIAAAMVDETTAAAAARGLHNVTVERMDAESLAFPDASFDYVLCSFAYFFFPHLDRALAEFHRVLRPGGVLALTAAGDPDERWRWYEELLNAFYTRHDLTHPALVGPGHRGASELATLLTDVGFNTPRAEQIEVEAVYAGEDEWWAARWTHSARRPLEAIPPELLQDFKAEVLARMMALKQMDGYHERWRIRCLLARKAAG